MNKCFLAKSPVGSLPFVHREFPIVGKFPCERGLYRARRSGGEPSSRDLSLVHEFLLLRKINSVRRFAANLFLRKIFAARGEQVLSWQSPGGALTTCELGNAPLLGAFPDRERALPRDKSCRDFNGRLRPSVFSCFWMKKWAETG